MIARVFPRRTSATPVDPYAFTEEPGLFLPDDITEVHVSVAFTYDLPRAEFLAKSWERIGIPVRIGGPATGERGEEFIPGRYLKDGYVITSRGCPNRCWFCSVWKREGESVRELPIVDGWNVQDDNLLACSDSHIRGVFAMLAKQPTRAQFTGGLEAARLLPWHVDELAKLNPKQIFFAYDTPDDYEPLRVAGIQLQEAGFTWRSRKLRCYVLIGSPNDTMDKAEQRLMQAVDAGFWPMAMLYRDSQGRRNLEWMRLQKLWARPAHIAMHLKELGHGGRCVGGEVEG